jgi:predicted flap endonuclease-1-like 5' DNA nuclease
LLTNYFFNLETNMTGFMCCIWWFLLGLLLGWLLNWLLSNWLRKDDNSGSTYRPGSAPNSFASANAGAPAVGTGIAVAAVGAASGVNFVAAAAAGFHVRGEDDLAIIEGIGPKIRSLFNDSGIRTFEQVSKMSVDEMKAILEKGGPRFKLANPGSWAEQARLAHRNEWAALKKLQDELDAGVAHS